ncbi:amblin-like [Gastrophryne carolinensis]
MRWTYDRSQDLCRIFQTQEPGSGPNVFQTEMECLSQCSERYGQLYPPEAAVCDLKQDPGLCMALIPMWYYNKTLQACNTFFYGGCQGNGNRFESKEECLSRCAPSKGLVIGIVFGCVFGVAFLVTLVMYLVQRKKLKKHQHKPVPAQEMH